jgi:glycosyltransferase involved in cell wall biosynthesis
MRLTIATIVCAYNESRLLPGCLYSLRAQTRPPDDILVINNASTDGTGAVARAVPGVRVVEEPDKGLVVAREAARRAVQADIVAYVDARSANHRGRVVRATPRAIDCRQLSANRIYKCNEAGPGGCGPPVATVAWHLDE